MLYMYVAWCFDQLGEEEGEGSLLRVCGTRNRRVRRDVPPLEYDEDAIKIIVMFSPTAALKKMQMGHSKATRSTSACLARTCSA